MAAICLLVMVNPAWRLRVTRDWGSETSPFVDVENATLPGFTPELLEAAAARFSEDPEIQSFALEGQVKRVPNDYSGVTAEHHNRYNEAGKKQADAVFQGFRALSQGHPQSDFVRAKWLREIMARQIAVESPELMESYHLPSYTSGSWVGDGTLAAALDGAREGARREPDNAFWPWTEASFQLALRRDKAALDALGRAGACSRFDDRGNLIMQRRLALLEATQATDIDDEVWEVRGAPTHHFAVFRAVVRQMMWTAGKSAKGGDRANALRQAGIVMAAGKAMARGNSALSLLVGEAVVQIVWRETVLSGGGMPPRFLDYFAKVGRPEAVVEYRRDLARAFAGYAAQCGRADLGREAVRLAASFRGGVHRGLLFDDEGHDTVLQSRSLLSIRHWIGFWLVRLAGIAMAIWLLSSPTGWIAPASSGTRRFTVIASAFSCGVTAVLLAAGLHFGLLRQMEHLFPNQYDPGDPQLFFFTNDIALYLALCWLSPALLGAMLAAVKWPGVQRADGTTRRVVSARAALYIGTIASLVAAHGGLVEGSAKTATSLWTLQFLSFWLFLAASCTFDVWRASRRQKLSAALWTGGIVLLAVANWVYALVWAPGRWNAHLEGGILVAHVVAVGLILTSWLVWFRIQQLETDADGASPRPFGTELLSRVRLTAASLTVCASLAYFLMTIGTLPRDLQIKHVIDQELAVGEVPYVLSHAESFSPLRELRVR